MINPMKGRALAVGLTCASTLVFHLLTGLKSGIELHIFLAGFMGAGIFWLQCIFWLEEQEYQEGLRFHDDIG